MAGSPCIEDLLAEARHHRHRYDLYRAKVDVVSQPTRITLNLVPNVMDFSPVWR